MDTQILIDKIINAIGFAFKDDKTAPGLTIAKVKQGYYCSVVRYNGAFGKDKKVVCNAKADKLEDALQNVATKFLTTVVQPPRNPVQELDALVKKV